MPVISTSLYVQGITQKKSAPTSWCCPASCFFTKFNLNRKINLGINNCHLLNKVPLFSSSGCYCASSYDSRLLFLCTCTCTCVCLFIFKRVDILIFIRNIYKCVCMLACLYIVDMDVQYVFIN